MATRTALEQRRQSKSQIESFLEIQTRVGGISPKMLTRTLGLRERDGLLRRTVTASVPVRMDYELTELRPDRS
ncbi:MAG TPA: winged helix-turn-helix transcriptional regulator [Propionibacteriaceae bacterium]